MTRSSAAQAAALAGGLAMLAGGLPACAEDGGAVQVQAAYRADFMGVIDGGLERGARYLDNATVSFDADLQRAVGWSGGKVHANLLNNLGGRPNDLVGSLQGVDNIEVGERRLKLYEAWLEQDLPGGAGSVRAGLYDLNSEFDVTDASALLINPSFGIAPEVSATGPGGPSIFPSTSLAARLEVHPAKSVSLRAVVLNARPGDPGDRGGVDLGFDDGVLLAAEAGWEGPVRLTVGAWRYTERQDDLRELDPQGRPIGHPSEGAYLTAEAPLLGREDARQVSGFLRAGVSDGKTGPFSGSVAAGVLVERAWPGRPDSALSAGLAWARLSTPYRALARDLGEQLASDETILELTYSDKVMSRLTLQPDVQYVVNPGGSRLIGNALVLGLRATLTL